MKNNVYIVVSYCIKYNSMVNKMLNQYSVRNSGTFNWDSYRAQNKNILI